MRFSYFTEYQKRRQAAQASGSAVNGINFLTVDTAHPTELRVELFQAAALTVENLELTGSPGSPQVRIIAADRDRMAANVLLVTVNVPGNEASYRLSLRIDAETPVAPAPFDPLLSAVEFSFRPEAARDIDCGAAPRPLLDGSPETRIDYLAKDFNSFRQLMLDRLSAIAPAWTERSPTDLGMALVDLLAYRADYLSYYQDAVATEAYLGTARRRISVRRHARLLDYLLHEGCNARAFVWLQVSGVASARIEPGSTAFVTRSTDKALLDRAELAALLESRHPLVFEPLHAQDLYPAHNEIPIYTWDEDSLGLPRGTTRTTLRDRLDGSGKRVLANLASGDLLLFEELLSPATGRALDADPAHRHVVRLIRVTPYSDPTTTPATPIVDVEWAAEDALPFSLCVKCATISTPLSVARGNIVVADQGLTVGPEPLVPPAVGSDGAYRPRLRQRGLTFAAPLLARAPAAATLTQDPRMARPAILELAQADGTRWDVVRDLLHSNPTARESVVEMDDQGTALLRFGDGSLGARPSPGVGFHATYRQGNGQAGNVGANVIVHAVTSVVGITSVRNPLPAAGGVDAESLDHARLAAPRFFRTQDRAVTTQDYVAAAERFPGVRRAAAQRRFTGSFFTSFVAVLRTGGAAVDETFRQQLRASLEHFRLNGTELVIVAPTAVPLEISLHIQVAPGHLRSTLRSALTAEFSTAVLADGRRAFFHPDNFSFGQPVYLGQVISAIMQVPGVAAIDTTDRRNHFRRLHRTDDDLRRGKIEIGPLEVAASGRTEFTFEGGL